MQTYGAYGLTNGFAVSVFYRDTEVTEIDNGISKTQCNVIFDDILGT